MLGFRCLHTSTNLLESGADAEGLRMLAKASVSSLVYPGVLFQFFLALDRSLDSGCQCSVLMQGDVDETNFGGCNVEVAQPNNGLFLV